MQRGLRVITSQGAIEKCPIYCYRNFGKMNDWMAPYFGGSNTIFADCISILIGY
jgi:hypothetical protein